MNDRDSMSVPPTDPDGSGVRRAALLLHALAPPDREWLLEQLPAGQRFRLEHLLAEIVALGIDGIASALPDLLHTDDVHAPAVSPSAIPGVAVVDSDMPFKELSVQALSARINALSPARLASLLCDEPDALVARVLSRTGRGRRATALRGLGPARRNRLASLLAAHTREPSHRAGPESRLERAVMTAILRHDMSLPPSSLAPRSPAAWLPDSLRRLGHRPSTSGASR